jgi:Mg-chelatase subunit ChlD
MRRAGVIYLLLITSVVSLSRLAYGSSDSDSSNQVLTLVVQNQRGEFVPDIKADQIVVKGRVASVQKLELNNGPRRILLLLDTSGSMGNYKLNAWGNVARLAIQFAQRRRANDLIGLDTFADKDVMLVPFTMDSRLVVRQIETLTTSGKSKTMLVSALSQILDRQEDGLRFGDAIILISDGGWTEEKRTDISKVRERLIRAGIRICFIRVPSDIDRMLPPVLRCPVLKSLQNLYMTLAAVD